MTEINKLVEECARAAAEESAGYRWADMRENCAYELDRNDFRSYARAVIRRTLEFAAGEIYPTHRRACACTRCDCGNFGDAQSVADWDAREDCSNHIRSLKAEG